MKTTPLSEIFEHVPPDAKAIMFIVRYGDNISNLINTVIDKLTDDTKQHQRALIVFGKGIPEEHAKGIILRISEKIKTIKGGAKNLHIHVISGVNDAKIKRIVRRYKNEGKVHIWK